MRVMHDTFAVHLVSLGEIVNRLPKLPPACQRLLMMGQLDAATLPLHAKLVTQLAPQTSMNQDRNVPLNWWSGAGSNRRPSAFQEALPVQGDPAQAT
jgi:hypothetical protein